MRVAQLLPYDASHHGGVREVVVHLSRELEARGHRVTVMGPTARPALNLDLPREIPIHTEPLELPANGSVARVMGPDGRAWESVFAEVEGGRFDVVHLHEPMLWLPLLAGMPAGPAVVGTFHAAGELDELGNPTEVLRPGLSSVMGPTLGGAMARLAGRGRLRRLAALARPVISRVLGRLDAGVAVSTAAREFAASYGPMPQHIIPNGVRIPEVVNRGATHEASDSGRPMILFFSRLDRRKGLDTLLGAMPRVRGQVPAARLVVAGNFAIEDERVAHYGALAERLGVDWELVPSPSDDEKARLFEEATLLAAPALGQESFGIILAEALAVGLPVVASDIQGYRDVLEGGRCGELVRPGDPRALAAGITRLLADRGRRAKLAEAGRRRAQELSWEAIAAQTSELYEEVLAGRAGGIAA